MIIHDAILGITPTIDWCVRLTEQGYMRFSGNQHNEAWSWNANQVRALDEEEASRIYYLLDANRNGVRK